MKVMVVLHIKISLSEFHSAIDIPVYELVWSRQKVMFSNQLSLLFVTVCSRQMENQLRIGQPLYVLSVKAVVYLF